jgi:hypothetical protein
LLSERESSVGELAQRNNEALCNECRSISAGAAQKMIASLQGAACLFWRPRSKGYPQNH